MYQLPDKIARDRVFGLVGGYLRSFETVRCGKEARDKLKIFVNRMLHASYPLSFVSYGTLHRPLFEPRNLVSGYKCKYGKSVFACLEVTPNSNFLIVLSLTSNRPFRNFVMGMRLTWGRISDSIQS